MQNASKVHEGLTMINMICVATHAERTHKKVVTLCWVRVCLLQIIVPFMLHWIHSYHLGVVLIKRLL